MMKGNSIAVRFRAAPRAIAVGRILPLTAIAEGSIAQQAQTRK